MKIFVLFCFFSFIIYYFVKLLMGFFFSPPSSIYCKSISGKKKVNSNKFLKIKNDYVINDVN